MAKKARDSDGGPPTGRSGEMGDGETAYAAIDVGGDDHQGLVRRTDSEPEGTTPAPPADAEETLAAEAPAGGAESPASRERRLTLQQLERFRRAMNKPSRSNRRSRRANNNNSGDTRESFDNLFTDDPTVLSTRELRVRAYPWAYWLFGVLVVVATSVFVDRVRAHALGYTPEEASRAHDWWKYAVAGVVYAVAVGVLCNGRVETLVMDKDAGCFSLRSTKPLCVGRLRRERRVERDLRSIADIRVEASGEFSGDVDTRCYKVHFEFADGSHAAALESRSKRKTLRRCRQIKDFLFSSLSATDAVDGSVGDASGAAVTASKYVPPAPLPSKASVGFVASASNVNSIAAAPLASIPSASLPRKVSTATAAASVSPAVDGGAP